jgi:nitroimidazol reductase NimA-like FMN-containing flavoprotein (pyridoxamine 5'-phosphate oxidase superfamily)
MTSHQLTIHQLTPEDCRQVLTRVHVARLACSQADQPYIVPILCYYDPKGDCLYSVAAAGQKVEWMRRNPKVCVEFSEIGDQFHWTTVVAFGRYEELTDSFADDDLRHRARTLFEQHREWWYPAMQKPEPGAPAKTVVYRIRIDDVTGRRASRE